MKTKLLLATFFISISFICHGQVCGIFLAKYNQEQTQVENLEDSPTDGRISMRLAGNGFFMTILIGFIPDGTVNYDDGFDGNFINHGATIEFYSLLGAIPLSIQALPELTTANVQVPLGYELTADETYTISIDAEFLNPDFDIILEDTYQNTFTDLRQTGYSFSGVVGEVNDRFSLNLEYRSGTLNVEDAKEVKTDLHAYFRNDILTIQTKETNLKTVELFNIEGKRIFSTDFKSKIVMKSLTHGIYILRFTNASGARVIKKIVK